MTFVLFIFKTLTVFFFFFNCISICFLAKAIGNIGFTSYNTGFYSESIYFLETGLKYALFDKKDSEKV